MMGMLGNEYLTFDKLARLAAVDGGTGVGGTYTHDRGGRRDTSTLANGITGSFAYDVNDRLTQLLQVAAPGGATLLDLGYGYDAEGNRLFTRNGTPGLEGRSEVYRYDNLNRLTAIERGVLNGPGTAVTTPLNHPKLASEQQWADRLDNPGNPGPSRAGLDRRGNWPLTRRGGRSPRPAAAGLPLRGMRRVKGWVDSPSGFPITRQQTRQANGVNAYTSIDPDGTAPPWAPVDLQPRTLQHDPAGNLTLSEQYCAVGHSRPDVHRDQVAVPSQTSKPPRTTVK